MSKEGIELPSFFLCPISLQLMKDPVTLPTGITYDRHNIETWIFTNKRSTCPVTNQPIPSDCDPLTPNHTMRRIIQAWCDLNACHVSPLLSTLRIPINRSQIIDLLHGTNSGSPLSTIKRLKSIIAEGERNRHLVESSGAIEFLASTVRKHFKDEVVVDEALNALHSLQMSEKSLDELIEKNVDFVNRLTCILERSGFRTRAYATMLLKSIIGRDQKLNGVKEGMIIVEMVRVVEDRISNQAMMAALHVLNIVVSHGRNRVKAVKEGAVQVVIDLMMEEKERKMTEMALVVLSRLSECAEGMEKIVRHGAGTVSKKMVRISTVASERAIIRAGLLVKRKKHQLWAAATSRAPAAISRTRMKYSSLN